MFHIFGYPSQLLFGQLLIGLINGSFYAMMSLGVAVIFGLLRIANFVHGAQYMLGAFCAWFLYNMPSILGPWAPSLGYWWAFFIVPVVIGLVGIAMERVFIRRVYDIDHAYGLLLTVGLAMVLEGLFNIRFGAAGQAYAVPDSLDGGVNLHFMFLPYYRAWVIVASAVICFGTWILIERTKFGSYLRAATENAPLVRAFGVKVSRLLTLAYGFGVGLAGLAGVMAAPIYQVSPQMGQNIVIVIFAVVVIGGMGSIFGAIVSGLTLGVIEGLTKVFYPEASSTVIFVIMAIVLVLRPAGLFGKPFAMTHSSSEGAGGDYRQLFNNGRVWFVVLAILGLVAPFAIYPVFLTKVLCFALFACAYNLLFGYVGLLGFGHAAFFGASAYITAQTMLMLGGSPAVALLAGVLTATILGTVFGWLAIRRTGLYFAMITFALSQIIYFYAVQAHWTHGEDGVQGFPRGHLFGILDLDNQMILYFVVLAVFLAAFFLIYRIVESPFGQVLKSIRENEPRTISLGYQVDRFKLLAIVLSAALSGLAGGLNAIIFKIASLADVVFTTSADVLLMTLIGGAGTLLGPVAGAIILVTLQEKLAQFGYWVIVMQGVIFILCVLFLRKGVIGTLAEYLDRRRQRQSAQSPAPAPRTAP
jgi:branched-chain amino acid transport system permease protein